MRIGIDASRAFLEQRTGIEEYAYQVIRHLQNKLHGHQVILYTHKSAPGDLVPIMGTKSLPSNWEVKMLPFYYFWTQVGLAWEMLTNPVDVLFVPAHTLPWIHPKKSIVTVHGLEYEHCPESYSFCSRVFHRFFVKKSCKWASKIVSVSKNTKKDLVKMYGVPKEKIEVVYNGYENSKQKTINSKQKENTRYKISAGAKILAGSHESRINSKFKIYDSKYILFISRLEKRKNVEGIVKAFDILKRKYKYDGKLVLAGRPGHGYEDLKAQISKLKSRYDIVEAGFISEEEKWQLLSNTDVFLFPSLCEGFGIPIIEAQSLGIPVVTSNIGPMDEVAGDKNILVDPLKPEHIAEVANRLSCDKMFREQAIQKGLLNVKRFSWEEHAEEIAKLF